MDGLGSLTGQRGVAGTPASPGPRRSLRRLAHASAIAAGWALFFWGWQRVLSRGADFDELRALILGAAIVVPVVTISWILHNRGIHRRKGPRRRVAHAVLEYRVDFHGREVVADFRALAKVQRVEVIIEDAVKRYREVLPTHANARADVQAGTSDLATRARDAIDHAGHAPLAAGLERPLGYDPLAPR